MTSFSNILLVIVSLIFTSCRHQKKDLSTDKWRIRYERESQLDALNLLNAQKLSRSSNSIVDWDTVEKFTYSLQETFENSSRPISFMGEVKDIVKRDSTYILKVAGLIYQSNKYFIAEISVNSAIFQELKFKLDPKERNEGCFIFQVSKISSFQLGVKSEIKQDGTTVEDASSYIVLDLDETLIKFQGNLVTYFIYDRLEEDDE